MKKLDREIRPLYGHHGVRYKLTTSGSKKNCLIIFVSRFRTVPSASFSFLNSAIQNFRSFFINVALPKILFFVFVSNHSVFSCIQSCFSPTNFFFRSSMLLYMIKYVVFLLQYFDSASMLVSCFGLVAF